MASPRTFDLRGNMLTGVSLPPDETYSAGSDTTGAWVDMTGAEGPIHAVCAVGAASGGPTAQSINFHLEEADDTSGTNSQKVSSQTEVTLTSDDADGIIQGLTTKPVVRVVVDDGDSSFTAGTSPAIEVTATVMAQDKSFT